jgi:hypothetical protein
MEKAIREGETGRVRGPISVARPRSQGSQRRGKSLKWPPLSTSGAETVSGADCVVVEAVSCEPVSPPFSLRSGYLTGNFPKTTRLASSRPQKRLILQGFGRNSLLHPNRDLIRSNSEAYSANRDCRARISEGLLSRQSSRRVPKMVCSHARLSQQRSNCPLPVCSDWAIKASLTIRARGSPPPGVFVSPVDERHLVGAKPRPVPFPLAGDTRVSYKSVLCRFAPGAHRRRAFAYRSPLKRPRSLSPGALSVSAEPQACC